MADAKRPVVEIISDGTVAKRKRSLVGHSLEVNGEGEHEPKRRKVTDGTTSELENSEERVEHVVEQETDAAVDSSRVRDAIESQFSLEILLKHDELRLINQELAKCQASMEQLRRCHLIPYPSSQGNPESMLNITNGTGHSLRQGDNVPRWATPYGVSDGPYTKHYSKWLLPDYAFDGVQDGWSFNGSRAGKTVDGRSTRNSFGDGSTSASKSRSQRGSTGQKLQALSSGYAQPKEKVGPSTLKRQADGQMVKLVCIDCSRENFSSTQGFINHCRIAHHRDFKSHEEAAVASGQPIEVDEAGGIVGEEKAPSDDGLVHPLIRSAKPGRADYAALLSHIESSMALFNQGQLPGVTSIPTSAAPTPVRTNRVDPRTIPALQGDFTPSPATPYLSSFIRRQGLGGNLTDIVGDAQTPVDFEAPEFRGEESDGENQSERHMGGLDGAYSPLPVRMPARSAISPTPFGRPGSSKGVENSLSRKPGISPRMSYSTSSINTVPTAHAKPSPLLVNSHHDDLNYQHDGEGEMDMVGPSLVDLSPNTVASNNAPSLVSDDGEYDEGDDAESVSSAAEDEGSDVAEIDIEDGEVEKVVARTVLRNRSGSGGDSMRMKKEDKHVKHVTFVSPVKETKVKGRARK